MLGPAEILDANPAPDPRRRSADGGCSWGNRLEGVSPQGEESFCDVVSR